MSFRRLFHTRVAGGSRWFSSTPPKTGSKLSSSLREAKDYILKNRQAFVNIFGFFIVFSYSVHNFKIETKWKEMQGEYNKIEEELHRVQSSMDENWITSIEDKVKAGASLGDVLKSEIRLVLHPPSEDPKEEILRKSKKTINLEVNEATAAEAAAAAASEDDEVEIETELARLIKLGTTVENVGDGKSKGKMI